MLQNFEKGLMLTKIPFKTQPWNIAVSAGTPKGANPIKLLRQ
jgi:hypothetical protein